MASLEDLYREIILDHYRNPRNRGELEVPPAVQAVGFNPLCGDEIIIYVEVRDGVIAEVSTGGQGCSISQSSASMMSTAVKGRSVDEAQKLVRAFKNMMSIHGSGIGGSGDDLDDHEDESGGDSESNEPDGVKLGDLEALRGVVKFPVRIKCATLSWNTLVEALDQSFD
ncbi:MAG: SUF system NifU family Fe-S cluster assembly protein [Acidimicrobiaceae bacterium]|nr:SUF system NifU family Fe-S cluster assembly protein [Acidimicrobiaceae bacterium]MCY4175986.1 SUF system NifU family Fe-S cluster assembly protein [Acidimicrobiaceae bacterium]MCY4280448.1 SUF system NifU family Fe-S cluster assembly protein [Acidimicrobiaceae bacterium]MCY4295215.1 SUF system NifU family Fe-S cluster assembly protein [Acidimicrobiaceae bacterium]